MQRLLLIVTCTSIWAGGGFASLMPKKDLAEHCTVDGKAAGFDAFAAKDAAVALFPMLRVQYVADCNEGTANRLSFAVRRKGIGTIPLDDLRVVRREGFPSGARDRMAAVALYWRDGERRGRSLTFDFLRYFRFLERPGNVDIIDN